MQGALNGIDHNLYGMMYVTFLGTIKSFESVWTITFKTFHTIIWTFTIVFTWVLVAGTNWERRCLQPLSALMNYYIKCFKYCGGYRINVPVKKRCLYQLHNRVSRVNVYSLAKWCKIAQTLRCISSTISQAKVTWYFFFVSLPFPTYYIALFQSKLIFNQYLFSHTAFLRSSIYICKRRFHHHFQHTPPSFYKDFLHTPELFRKKWLKSPN